VNEILQEKIHQAIHTAKFRFQNEKDLQIGVASILSQFGDFQSEVWLNPKDRIDFLIQGIGVEVKCNDSAGGVSLSSVTRQLWRYAQSDRIQSLILVTTRSKHVDLPSIILKKPLTVIYLINSVF
jgi:hypothetical protein